MGTTFTTKIDVYGAATGKGWVYVDADNFAFTLTTKQAKSFAKDLKKAIKESEGGK